MYLANTFRALREISQIFKSMKIYRMQSSPSLDILDRVKCELRFTILTPLSTPDTVRKEVRRSDRIARVTSLKTLRGTRRKRAFLCCHRQLRAGGVMVDAFSR